MQNNSLLFICNNLKSGGIERQMLEIAEALQQIYSAPSPELFHQWLKKWYFWATHSRIPQIIEAAKTIKRHWDGVINWVDYQISNGILEGFNSVFQATKAKARG